MPGGTRGRYSVDAAAAACRALRVRAALAVPARVLVLAVVPWQHCSCEGNGDAADATSAAVADSFGPFLGASNATRSSSTLATTAFATSAGNTTGFPGATVSNPLLSTSTFSKAGKDDENGFNISSPAFVLTAAVALAMCAILSCCFVYVYVEPRVRRMLAEEAEHAISKDYHQKKAEAMKERGSTDSYGPDAAGLSNGAARDSAASSGVTSEVEVTPRGVSSVGEVMGNPEMGMHRVRSDKSDENMLAVDFLAFASGAATASVRSNSPSKVGRGEVRGVKHSVASNSVPFPRGSALVSLRSVQSV